jgi:hypothetical protein
MKVMVKKTVTTFEFQIVDYKVPEHGNVKTGHPVCKCKNCRGEAISLAIKKNDWYCNDDEYETKFETEID